MQKQTIYRNRGYGDEAPRLKDFLLVLGTMLVLMALSWLSHFTFHWF